MNPVTLDDRRITVQAADPTDPAEQRTGSQDTCLSLAATLSERDQVQHSRNFWEEVAPFLELAPGWDSYGAAAVSSGAIESAYGLFCSVMRPSTSFPNIVPTPRGGIQLEWDTPGLFIEVETLGRNRFGVLVEDKSSGAMDEFEIIADLTPLLKYFDRLSNAS